MTYDDKRRAIGKVVSVSADRFVIELHGGTDNFTVVGFDDVHYVARLGSYLMVPVQTEYVVVEIVGLREKDPTTFRIDSKDSGELDKTASAKYLDVVPVGMLPQSATGRFRFGVSTYPSLYADALYALDLELDRIFQVDGAEPLIANDCEGETGFFPLTPDERGSESPITGIKAISIGTSVVFQGYDVKVKLDEFFGGHTAILGNTGSGKSCTVSAILQSLFSKPNERIARGATFVFFDVNGEYKRAFQNFDTGINVKHIVVDGTADEGSFTLPHWFLNFSEWELLIQASEKTQLPVLRTALGLTSLLQGGDDARSVVRKHFVAKCILECFRGSDGDSPVAKIQRVSALLDRYGTDDFNRSTLQQHGCNEKFGNFDPPANQQKFLDKVKEHLTQDITLPFYDGKPFTFKELGELIDFSILYEEAHGNRHIRDYCSSMLTRFKGLCEREEFAFLRHNDITSTMTEADFLLDLLGLEKNEQDLVKDSQIIILDMNKVGDDVVELVSAVITRMVFEQLRQATPRNRFPVHLVLEEAHRYIAERPSVFAIDASRIFERVAKEGRKYGLFLMVASQRPSELSKTVLSQCSNFVVHRIQNPDDLAQIRQMTPFISENVLRRLPSLPKQHALVFGNAVNIPMTFKVRHADPTPHSDDAAISRLWYMPLNTPIEASFANQVNDVRLHPEVEEDILEGI